MNIRVLSVLGILAVAMSLAAAWAVQREVADWRTPASGKKVFPNLDSRLDDARKLVVRRSAGPLTILRQDGGWQLVESDGYPVQSKTVQRTLVALSELRWLEPKTREAKRYAKLQVEDVDAKGSKSRRLTVYDAKGTALADLIVGKENQYLQAISDGGTYIRMPHDKQAWLTSGHLTVGDTPKDWLVNQLFDISRKRIAQAEIHHPNGNVIKVHKTGKSDPAFEVEDIPAGKNLADKLYPTDIGRALETFEIRDARKADKIPFAAADTVSARFQTVDDLVIRLQITTIDKQRWVRLDTTETTTPSVRIQNLAKTIATATKGWAFRIPEFEAVHFFKPWAKIVEDASGK